MEPRAEAKDFYLALVPGVTDNDYRLVSVLLSERIQLFA